MASGLGLVDPRIRSVVLGMGIERLYPPQEEALPAALSGRNLVLAIPTASGKSLVAYLAIAHRYLTLSPPGKALYIVPLRALASEKYEDLQRFKALGLGIGIATGDLDEQDNRLGRYDVIVATSEKADALMRHRAQWLEEVRTLVVDEVHLLTDPSRGPTLEVLLARFRSLNPKAQVLALSATIRNAKDLAAWLDANLIESEWRPTQLKKGVLFGRAIEFDDGSRRVLGPDTGDPVADLALDILDENGQALVFLSTRKSAESVAKALAAKVKSRVSPEDRAKLGALARAVSDDEEFVEFPDAAPPDGDGPGAPPAKGTLGGRLAHVVASGVAFHNAGLSSRQRRLVEQHFRSRLLRVICATPTLAAGVNTPSRRVIIRDVYRFEANLGSQPLPVLEVHQMMGRAGRPGYDPYGEAVLLAKSADDKEALVETYLRAGPEPIRSKLGSEPALRVHLLAGIAAGFTPTVASVERFLDSTFYAHEGETWLIKEQLREVLRFLAENDFITREGDQLRPTLFGKRTSDLYIDPLSALVLRRAIEAASRAAHEVTPFAYLHAIASTPDIDPLYLRTKDDWVVQKTGEVEDQLLFNVGDARSQEEFVSQVKTASLLEDWIEETPLDQIEERYGIGPGDVRNKVDLGEWLAHALRELARLFHFETAAHLNDLPLRLRAGAKKELLPLIELQGIGRVRARILHRAGYKTLGLLRKAREADLAGLRGIGPAVAASLKKQVGGEEREAVPLGEFGS